MKILIVDGNEKNVRLLGLMANFIGHETILTADAEEGLRLAREELPNLILMDTRMPRSDGVASLKKLKGDARTKGIPVIALTSCGTAAEIEEILAGGFSACLSKPIDAREFREVLEGHLGGIKKGELMTGDKRRILVADDDEKNLKLMSAVLGNAGYWVDTAKDGIEAVGRARELSPDLVFMDIMMPEMDGYEACRRLKGDISLNQIPVIMVTALTDRESRLKGLEAGANDFLTKPIDSTELLLRAKNLLKVKEFEDFLREYNNLLSSEVAKRTKELNDAFQELSVSREHIKEGYLDTIQRLTIVAKYKDEETASHIRRISHYCRAVAKSLGWQDADAEILFYASPMHDIGKVGIPSDILLKPSKLSPEEFALIKTHTSIGKNILHGSSSKFLQTAETIALSHHERWDGSGYPEGLKGEEIPLEGRIMSIADQYDALRSARPYKLPLNHAKVFKIITEGDGRTMPSHFDPRILQVFKDNHLEFEGIYETHRE